MSKIGFVPNVIPGPDWIPESDPVPFPEPDHHTIIPAVEPWREEPGPDPT